MDQPANDVIDRLVGAVQTGRLDYLKAYHQAGLSVTVHDNNGWALLLHACMNHPPNQPEMVAWLLEAKADPNQRSNKRVSALQVAARFGFEAIVETLLEAKADINAQDHQGHTALFCASEKNHSQVLEVLARDARLDVNLRSNKGWTALLIAARKKNYQAVQLLIGMKADLAVTTNSGHSLLHIAALHAEPDLMRLVLVETRRA